MTDHAAIVREGLHACGYGSGLTVAAQRECFAALDALEAQRDEARNTRAVQDAGSIRKVEAYDAARAEVKRDGYSRAEYVLRAEAAEAEVARLESALRGRIGHGHNDTCSSMLGAYECTCGQDDARAALGEKEGT